MGFPEKTPSGFEDDFGGEFVEPIRSWPAGPVALVVAILALVLLALGATWTGVRAVDPADAAPARREVVELPAVDAEPKAAPEPLLRQPDQRP